MSRSRSVPLCWRGPACSYLASEGGCWFLHLEQEAAGGGEQESRVVKKQVSTTGFHNLPEELQLRIFSLLGRPGESSEPEESLDQRMGQDFSDLCSAALVCRSWRRVVDDPLLWRELVLHVQGVQDAGRLSTLLQMTRLTSVRTLVVDWCPAGLSKLWKCLVSRTGICGKLETLVCYGENIKDIADFRGLSFLKHVVINDILDWNQDQKTALFTSLAAASRQETNKLESLILDGELYLESVEPRLLAQVVGSLRRADLPEAYLTLEQVNAILESLEETDNLEELRIEETDLSQVEPQMLARVVHKLRKVSLDVVKLEQLEQILKMSTGGTNLKELFLMNDTQGAWERVPRELVEEARKHVSLMVIEEAESLDDTYSHDFSDYDSDFFYDGEGAEFYDFDGYYGLDCDDSEYDG